VGEGYVIMLGTLPSGHAMRRIISTACERAGIDKPNVEGRVMVVNRDNKGVMLVEYAAKPAEYVLAKPAKDLISGKVYESKVELKPYDVKVLEYI
jgi:beta-galactosidase GanA